MAFLTGYNLPFQKEARVIGNSIECVLCAKEIEQSIQDKDISTLCKVHVTVTNSIYILAEVCEINCVVNGPNANAICEVQVAVAATRLLKNMSQLLKKEHQQRTISKLEYLTTAVSALNAGAKVMNYCLYQIR